MYKDIFFFRKFSRKRFLRKKKFELWSFFIHFCDVITPIFDEFFTITRKIEIGEFFYSYFPSIQHIPHPT